jgi:hypothetical protein
MLTDRGEANELLRALGASKRLMRHGQLVSEAADLLLIQIRRLGVSIDFRTVELGAVMHDAGKIRHPEELFEAGSLHEKAGEALLLAQGVQPEVARCCSSHNAWIADGISLEERTVALADKLWKGRRDPELELLIVDEIASKLRVSRWDVFEQLDNCFEEIATGGISRVQETILD